MKNAKVFMILAAILAFFICSACSRPRQIQRENGGRNITFWGFDGTTSLSDAQNQISAWDIDYVMDDKASYATISTEWVSYQNIDYSQAVFYFNAAKKLYKVRCYISGARNCKKIQSQLNFKYDTVAESGQKANERTFLGKNGSKAVLTNHSSEEYSTLQITFDE